MKNFFKDAFDINGDGSLDPFELGLGYMIFDECTKDDDENEDSDLDDWDDGGDDDGGDDWDDDDEDDWDE